MGLFSDLRALGTGEGAPPTELETRLKAAEALLQPLADAHGTDFLMNPAQRWDGTVFGRALDGAGDEQLRAAALWAHRTLNGPRAGRWGESYLVTALSRRKLAWTVAEVEWAVQLSVRHAPARFYGTEWIRVPLAAAERLSKEDRDLLAPLLRNFATTLTAGSHIMPTAERHRLLRRLSALVGEPETQVERLPPSLLHDGDAFGPAIRAEFGQRLEAPGVPALLVHAASLSSPTPSAKWLAEARRLLQATDEGAGLVRELLERALHHRETTGRQNQWRLDDYVWVHTSAAVLLRGLIATIGDVGEPWVAPLLGDLAVYAGAGNGGSATSPRDLVVANAAVAALARRTDAVPQLARVQARLKHRGILKGVAKALDAAARAAGMTRSQLLETAVPDHRLGPDGRRTEALGTSTAVLEVRPPGTVTLTFANAQGRALTGVPAEVREHHAGALAALRADVKEIKKTVTTQRLRLEGLLAEGRTWDADEWQRLYRDHPVVGRLISGLLWQTGDGELWCTALLHEDGTLTGIDGTQVHLGRQVRLWHPATAAADEVRSWRNHLLDAGLRQPFKQAFREVYLLTPAEMETADHSNRFAAHILRAPQAQALMRARGWSGNALGYYDGGSEGHVTREFGDEWRAEFYFDLVENAEDDRTGTPTLASSDQVRFSRRETWDWAHRPLAEVPPLVFTEAMRDVDLFVAVTSIAADPTWITREARHAAYWQQVSFGDLTESAQNRREALERLVPRLTIADRCTVTERFLEVRGDLRTYKIHLGSANILMSPNDAYLCIVPARGSKDPKVFLPFEEGGGTLSVILSKAFLLADDRNITDASIRGQIRRS